jgi:hypothetical protein
MVLAALLVGVSCGVGQPQSDFQVALSKLQSESGGELKPFDDERSTEEDVSHLKMVDRLLDTVGSYEEAERAFRATEQLYPDSPQEMAARKLAYELCLGTRGASCIDTEQQAIERAAVASDWLSAEYPLRKAGVDYPLSDEVAAHLLELAGDDMKALWRLQSWVGDSLLPELREQWRSATLSRLDQVGTLPRLRYIYHYGHPALRPLVVERLVELYRG